MNKLMCFGVCWDRSRLQALILFLRNCIDHFHVPSKHFNFKLIFSRVARNEAIKSWFENSSYATSHRPLGWSLVVSFRPWVSIHRLEIIGRDFADLRGRNSDLERLIINWRCLAAITMICLMISGRGIKKKKLRTRNWSKLIQKYKICRSFPSDFIADPPPGFGQE